MSRSLMRCIVPALFVALVMGCGAGGTPAGALPPVEQDPGNNPLTPRTRYSFNNQCFALKSNLNNRYVAASGTGYAASVPDIAGAEAFYLKPSALGKYLLYSRNRQLMSGSAPVANQALANATDASVWTVTGVGDATVYPPVPVFDQEPSKETVDAFHNFVDPNVTSTAFRLISGGSGQALLVDEGNALTTAAPSGSPAESFTLVAVTACEEFPEAQSNVVGQTFKGTTPDGRVLGMADVHVHITATTFLGHAEWGTPFHKFGVTHALGDCDPYHGPQGSKDGVGAAYVGDTDGHDTTGWPNFPDWPKRDSLTHEAIYWKWLERSWQAGLRIAVNDLVENETLCELQRNAANNPNLDCNEMNNAGKQAGSSYAMQDYIDAQYGGRGAGWFQIVHDAAEARRAVEAGKLAVILGIEVSNFLNCKLTYNQLRQQEPFEETGGAAENTYACAMTETGADNEILTQLKRIKDLGVRQIISIHEFDNAFGGNGIFDGEILNLGNRENSGGIPSGTIAGPFATDPETPTGEFWTTYECPEEDVTPGFSGYLWGDAGGASMTNTGPPPPVCQYTGQGGRPGGTTACYPAKRQCNARWMTPMGLYTYSRIMEMGFIFDFDHLEMEMKTQALELAEAQSVPYPFVSTHGTFGGTSNEQARRVLKNGGVLYPSLGNGPEHIAVLDETLAVYNQAMAPVPADQRPLFGFGFGTDTNGLSKQSDKRSAEQIADKGAVVYPYTLFKGPLFSTLADFSPVAGVTFEQPSVRDPDGNGRSWHIDQDGSAHHGMLSDMVQEMRLHGSADHLRHLYNAAEAYLQMWQRTEQSSQSINANGIVVPGGILRQAPPAETACLFTPSGACGT